MSIAIRDLKALLQKSGNRCAFPGCGAPLLLDQSEWEGPVVLSEIAHIVGEKIDGPRGKSFLSSEERDRESNLLLLCEKHHHIVDSKPQYYTVERLRQMKEDHETLMQQATGDAVAKREAGYQNKSNYVHETVYSTLFPVTDMPALVYGAPCKYTASQSEKIRSRVLWPKDKNEMVPYIINGGNLYAFQNLSLPRGPFCNIVNRKAVQQIPAHDWWDDPIRNKWFVDLLNRSLNKLTGHKGLQWDRDHHRYYFQPDEQSKVKEVTYRPLNQSVSSKQVVWQPISTRTHEPRPYWLHRAVNLRFHHVSSQQWCLSIRPEFRVTLDGLIPEASEKIGSRVTRKKSHMFNYDLLGEVNFWRDFLSDGEPRIIFNFGKGQYLSVSTTMMQTEIDWPGIPQQYAKPFKNVEYAEDLFSWAKLAGLTSDDPDDQSDVSEEDDSDWEESDDNDE